MNSKAALGFDLSSKEIAAEEGQSAPEAATGLAAVPMLCVCVCV